MLMAGLKGIEEGYDLPEPMETNLYELTDKERHELGIESLPASLGEAIAITEKSDLIRQTLGDHAFERLIEVKKREWDDFRIQVTEYELQRYLPIL
jgi:glutamine synthetase